MVYITLSDTPQEDMIIFNQCYAANIQCNTIELECMHVSVYAPNYIISNLHETCMKQFSFP